MSVTAANACPLQSSTGDETADSPGMTLLSTYAGAHSLSGQPAENRDRQDRPPAAVQRDMMETKADSIWQRRMQWAIASYSYTVPGVTAAHCQTSFRLASSGASR
jgi:hypothetical protein